VQRSSGDEVVLWGDATIEMEFGRIDLEHSFPTDDASAALFDLMDSQRAAQAYVWSLPLVGFAVFRDQQASAFGANQPGDFVVFESLREKRGIVTANLTTPYVLNWTNLADGPIVIDYPAGQTAGGVLDFWQRPVADLGLTGPDRGMGGRYLLLGPAENSAASGGAGEVTVIQSATNNVLIGLRLLDPDPAAALAFKQAVRMGRVGQESGAVRFIEGLDREWSATPPRGLDYWRLLAKTLDEEPVREVDKIMMAMLEPLGIAKGVAFDPDRRQRRILIEAAAVGELMIRNIQVNPRYTRPYWDGTSWYKSFDFDTSQETESKLQLDERATWFYEAVTSSKGMVYPEPGSGQVYMTTKRDNAGHLLRADRTYRLHVPADVPVAQFWSLTLYSENTRRLYENGGTTGRSVNLDSRDEMLAYNPDGSIDLYIGPEPPPGAESNWLKTISPDGWFVYFRLYAPTEAWFDKSWALPDFEPITPGDTPAASTDNS